MTIAGRPQVIASADIPLSEWSDVPGFAVRYRHLSSAALGQDYRIGIAIEELPAGMRSNPAHYHLHEEEHLYILDGELTAHIGSKTFLMKAGDYVVWPTGRRAGHYLSNQSTGACRYVILGENKPHDVVVYTDSQNVLIRSLGRRAIFDMRAVRNYWDGEPAFPQGSEPPPGSLGKVEADEQEPVSPISVANIEWNPEGPEGGSSTFGGRSRHLTYAAMGEGYHVGVLIECPEPGKRMCPKHYHMLEEEHALILEGEVTLLLGDERIPMKPGDYVCFPAGLRVGHSFLNSGDGPCSYLMIGERNPAEVCVYPDSNKVMVRALKSWDDVFDMAGTRGYWDGEG